MSVNGRDRPEPGPRVLLVTKGLDIGGLERVVTDLAVGLRRRDVDVEVALVNDRRDALAPLLERAGVTLHRLGGGDLVGFAASRRLHDLSRRFDIVNVHGPLISAVAYAVAPRRRVISTMHTPWSALRRPTQMMLRTTSGRAMAMVAVSESVAVSLPAPRAAVRVIPHGVDRVAVEAERDGRMAPPPSDPRVPCQLIAVASHREVKDYPNLLRAMRMSIDQGADLELVAVGDGPSLAANRKLADTLGLGAVVRFEAASNAALHRIACADLLVVASRFEGQPLVVSEALAVGTPVVATSVGGVPEILDEAIGRIVPVNDSGALASMITELALHRDVLDDLTSAARARPIGRTVDDVVDDYLDLFERVRRQ